MSNLGEENKVSGVFGGVELGNINGEQSSENAGTIKSEFEGIQASSFEPVSNGKNLPAKQGIWSKFKAFCLQEIDWNKEIKVELTPYQQKVEDEVNEFLHQEITWEKVHSFLFQDVTFGKKKA